MLSNGVHHSGGSYQPPTREITNDGLRPRIEEQSKLAFAVGDLAARLEYALFGQPPPVAGMIALKGQDGQGDQGCSGTIGDVTESLNMTHARLTELLRRVQGE